MEVLDLRHIPSWCTNIFHEKQEDPDKSGGFWVIAKLWDKQNVLLMEGGFHYTGQKKETIRKRAVHSGRVHTCTVHWKGKEIETEHDMRGLVPAKGDAMQVTIHNLQMLQ